jgi:anti-sigma factor RsiW
VVTYADGSAERVSAMLGQRNGRPAGVELADLSHQDVRDRLTDLLDNALDPAEAAHLWRHLAACPACAAFYRTLQRTVELLRALPAQPLPDRLRERLRAIPSEEPVA